MWPSRMTIITPGGDDAEEGADLELLQQVVGRQEVAWRIERAVPTSRITTMKPKAISDRLVDARLA